MSNSNDLQLRPTVPADLDTLFDHQAHEGALHMAAFTAKDPWDRAAYRKKWLGLLQDPTIHAQSIWRQATLLGTVVKFEMEGQAELTYAIDPAHWGQGIASWAVQQFLGLEPQRPLFARVAFDNYGSQRVLEKAGFQRLGQARHFAQARGQAIEEYIYGLGTAQ